MNLTPHFTRSEFERSDWAARNGIDNTVPDALLPNLQRTAELLEAIRRAIGVAIHISSGYRSPPVNAAIGGAANSAHMEARAADINADGLTPRQLASYIVGSPIAFDKVILEFGQWVHCQVERSGETPRRQVLTAQHSLTGTVYVAGLS